MRRRARHRLIGAAVLVLLGVVGFPMLFDTQPRPIPVDIAIEIPGQDKVAPLVVPSEEEAAKAGLVDGEEVLPSGRGGSAQVAAAPSPMATAQSLLLPDSRPAVAPKAAAEPEPKPEPKPTPKPEPKPEPKPAPKPEPRPDEAARARALLEGRTVVAAAPAAQEDGRFIVQIGAFADADKAREVRQKLERSGFKTYTQTVDTKDGKRTRVRVGPFAGRAEADKAASRIRGLDLPASILTL